MSQWMDTIAMAVLVLAAFAAFWLGHCHGKLSAEEEFRQVVEDAERALERILGKEDEDSDDET